MKTKRLNPLDASWLYVESRRTPMHVGGLLTFNLPEDAPPDFLKDLVADFKAVDKIYPPWNYKLKSTRLKRPVHYWVEDDDLDIDYHFRHSALPKPGGERELGVLASRLHSHPLDFKRPPWECHLIEGLEGNRFAMYIKMHHSLIDGISGMRLLARSLASEPDDVDRPPFWSIAPAQRSGKSKNKAKTGAVASIGGALNSLLQGVGTQVKSVPDLIGAGREILKSARDETDPLGVPFEAPKSVLNGRISGQRRYATQLYSVTQLKKLSKAADCTLNDIMLAICAGALRRYLSEAGKLPDKPLTAGIPVSVRPKNDQGTGNAISFIIATLATNVEDPQERLRAIQASTQRAKAHLQQLPASAINNYTIALMAPYILSIVTGLAGHVRPVFNVTISNVPGPEGPLYIRGAEMEAFYPTSLITHGQALNITCHGYGDTLGFGFIGCRKTLPSLQNLAVYAGETLSELESIYLPKKKTAKRKKA